MLILKIMYRHQCYRLLNKLKYLTHHKADDREKFIFGRFSVFILISFYKHTQLNKI